MHCCIDDVCHHLEKKILKIGKSVTYMVQVNGIHESISLLNENKCYMNCNYVPFVVFN